ncbi:MAG: MoaD/ThiS family protein [Firmicutes bacterium]|nr:MoaD/ThiS family protein [Bacillota bacterium]
MPVKIRFLGVLKKYQPGEGEYWVVSDAVGTKVSDLLNKVLAEEKMVGYIVIVGSVRKEKDYVLQEGDVVTLMPLITGG